MDFRIYDPETIQLAETLAAEAGEPLEEAILQALKERLEQVKQEKAALPKKRRPNRGRKNRR
ncbi:MAG TPA: type II toxin-antitoxin system VapB family antitoxin [Candidatus Acidoferrum sp.]|jgi:hypothetical protein